MNPTGTKSDPDIEWAQEAATLMLGICVIGSTVEMIPSATAALLEVRAVEAERAFLFERAAELRRKAKDVRGC